MTAPLKVAMLALNSPGYQSLALGYLRAYAQADDRLKGRVGFQTLDLTIDDDAWWVAYRVIGLEPDVLAVSVFCWGARATYDVCRIVKQALPDVRIVLGGPEVGPIAADVLLAHPEVDAVVRGEGEAAFADVLDLARRGKPFSRADGVTARDASGAPLAAPDRPLIADLDSIPSPYLTGVLEPREGSAYIETFRGCPHECAYCFEGKGYGRIRSFGRERVEAEIAYLAGECGVRQFSFIDAVFNLTPGRLEWLTGVLAPYAARGLTLHTIEVDIERIDDDAAALLRRAGVLSVETGPQSVGKVALATCRRKFDSERFAAGVAALKGQGILVETDLIAGLPGDTAEDFLGGVAYCLSLDPGKIQTSTLHVLPGTRLYVEADELGLRFDSEPPHEIVATGDIGFADLRRLEARSIYIARLHAARIEGE
ncbi:MAG: radical SAM protein [Coriobacteriia bacterium]|nr:radical SAM protein [Coriobacteriia bacterium]